MDERDHSVRPMQPDTAENSILERRDPTEHSDSGLLSRDYQPRYGGPELIASWPLGPPPSQTEPGNVDWEVMNDEFVQLQRNLTVTPFVGPIEYSKIYLGVRGTGCVETEGETLSIRLETTHLTGSEYETEIDVSNTSMQPFMTPMVEFAPDARDYREHTFIGREMYSGYVLSAAVTSGTGYLDQGTSVHLWSE
jgi:hypothetical protein